MDAGVVSRFRPQAFASRTAAERVKTEPAMKMRSLADATYVA
jgi:hypothetical protein